MQINCTVHSHLVNCDREHSVQPSSTTRTSYTIYPHDKLCASKLNIAILRAFS